MFSQKNAFEMCHQPLGWFYKMTHLHVHTHRLIKKCVQQCFSILKFKQRCKMHWYLDGTIHMQKKNLNVKQACEIWRFLYLSLFHAWTWSRQVLTRLCHMQGLFSFSLMTFRVIFRHWRWHSKIWFGLHTYPI